MNPTHTRHRNLLRVLTYHRIADPAQTPLLNPGLVSATPSVFAKQMKYLADNYHAVSLNQVIDCLDEGKALPKRAVLVTFDDGYFDFEEIAWPIVKRHRLPATIFVPTGFPDQPDRCFWWDKLYAAFVKTSREDIEIPALGRLPLGDHQQRRQSLARLQAHVKTLRHYEALSFVDKVCEKLGNGHLNIPSTMNWSQLRRLAQEGVALAAHTRNHPILTRVPLTEVREEIRGSYEDLRREIGTIIPAFAYPNGNHNEKIVKILKEEGFKVAFTGLRGNNDMVSTDPLRLCRLNIGKRTGPRIFRLRLLQWFTYVEKWRHRKKRHVDYFDDNRQRAMTKDTL
ncbi:MAG: polysaccharide deacetylase family protein [Gammaproteobacteria bacterium]|nr:polysaccharide deacetylase family protein [Gammaproteobacteria bacterium]